jgi:hypothetical protein
MMMMMMMVMVMVMVMMMIGLVVVGTDVDHDLDLGIGLETSLIGSVGGGGGWYQGHGGGGDVCIHPHVGGPYRYVGCIWRELRLRYENYMYLGCGEELGGVLLVNLSH